MSTVTCHITKNQLDHKYCYKADVLRPSIFHMIQKDFPDITSNDYISINSLNSYRRKQLETIIQQETGELSTLENEVIDSIANNKILSDNIEPDLNDNLTFGQRLADSIAVFGGSWRFIIIFFSFIVVWMLINIALYFHNPFDPYPFILLNLILSCLASIQAPIIMMSQNRREQKDRLVNEYEYKINLKAELEIKLLHEKIDHLMIHQNKRLLEIQEMQIDILEDIMKEVKSEK
ncbi:MAG: DUF1003 domain-containing protein [Cytophagales bacterium]|nr:DUF1003 domain-containing protein [Cytophaga sp.]